MRKSLLALSIGSLLIVSACGSDTEGTAGAGSGYATGSVISPPEGSTPAESPAASTAAGGAASTPATDGVQALELTGIVGTPDNPDAFVIALVNAAGEPVTTVPAGNYTIKVRDLSDIHNFHLMGQGVEQSTTVPAVTDVTWNVALQPGQYRYVCDPHPQMSGTLTVT